MTTIPISRPAKGLTLQLDQIEIPATARSYNATAVLDLSKSIATIGAPTVVERDGRFVLVAGLHRIEALKLLGIESVLVRVVDFDDIEARMWTISENFHRAELTAAQRADQVAEYAELVKRKREAEKPAQVAHVSGGRGNQGGDSLTARDLGISRDEVRRAQTIAALPEETKQAARDAGLDNNQSALLKAAKEQTSETQIAVLRGIKERGRVADDLPPPPEPDDYGHDPMEPAQPAGSVVAFKARPTVASAMGSKPLRNLENISGGEFARWIKITTPKDRPHVIRVLETAAALLRGELIGEGAA